MKFLPFGLLILAGCALLGSCGQRAPLVLPKPAADTPRDPASQSATQR